MAIALWFMGLLGLVVAAVVAAGRGRRAPADFVGRGVIAIAAIAYAAVVITGAWTWGATTAAQGRARLLASGAPVTVVLQEARVPVTRALTIGHGERADVRVPGEGVGEGAEEIVRVEPVGQMLVVRPSAPTTVVVVVPGGEDASRVATRRGCSVADAGDDAPSAGGASVVEVPVDAAVVVLECDGARPLSAEVLRHVVAGMMVVEPLVWRRRFVPQRLATRAGEVLRVGAGEQVPGLASWETIGPRDASAIVAVPSDPTDCAAWSPEGRARARVDGACVVEAGAFTFIAIPRLPDAAGVLARGLRAGLVIGAPAMLVLVALVAMPRRRRRAAVFARALCLAVLGAALVALACWRLLWAHRIDALRAPISTDTLLADNELAVVAIGAALAALASRVVAPVASGHARTNDARTLFASAGGSDLIVGVLAWSAWLAVGWSIAGREVRVLDLRTFGTLALSSIAGVLPALLHVGRVVARRWRRAHASAAPAGTHANQLAVIGWTEVLLAAVASAGVIAHAALPRVTACKLALAYAVALAARPALGVVLGAETPVARRATVAVTLAAAAIAVASYDTGIALAITGTGVLLALLVAGHDATYAAPTSARIGLLEREYARVVLVQALVAGALFVGVAGWALAAGDGELIARGATAVLHAPLVMAVMFVLAAVVARSHRRGWVPWLAAALAALVVWGARAELVGRVIDGDSTSAHRVAAHVEPGYALLADERAFTASVSAWREAAFAPAMGAADAWAGEGLFAARIRDPGVLRSIDNDYLPVLVARELGVGGLLQGIALIVVIAIGAGVIAGARLPHASRALRLRTHAVAIVCVLAVYQPLAALGVVPLTGISWPGLGIDSPSDLWLVVIGAVWCVLGGEPSEGERDDERVRATSRLVRARRVGVGALALGGVAAVILVGRAGASAVERVATDDARIAAALRYADTIACGDAPDGGVPADVGGEPTDAGTARFDRELRAAWIAARTALDPAARTALDPAARTALDPAARTALDPAARTALDPAAIIALDPAAITACTGSAGAWQLALRGDACVARMSVGWPVIEMTLAPVPPSSTSSAAASTSPASPSSPVPTSSAAASISPASPSSPAPTSSAAASTSPASPSSPAPMSSAAASTPPASSRSPASPSSPAPLAGWRASCRVVLDGAAVGILRAPVVAPAVPRIRVVSRAMGAAAGDVGEVVVGQRVIRLRPGAEEVELARAGQGTRAAGTVVLAPGVTIAADARGAVLRGAAELFVADGAAWRRVAHGDEVAIDRVALVASGPAERRTIVLVRPGRRWDGEATAVVDPLLADEARRLGDRTRRFYPYAGALPELGWVNPYAVERSLGLDGWIHAAQVRPGGGAACGTIAPPPIEPARVCSPSPLDGVLECRVALQPELAQALRGVVEELLAEPKRFTGRAVTPVRAAWVVLRGDTGELLAQGNVVPDRAPLAYAPADASAEAELVRLREEHGEADGERVEWNLPIAVGSTLKPIVARAVERAAPQRAPALDLSAAGKIGGCARGVGPLLGHCPPTSLAGQPVAADLHDFLARSPNWYQAALGLVGLALPDAHVFAGTTEVTLDDIAASDLSSWPTERPLVVGDAAGTILGNRTLSIDGLRRTPMWTHVERLLGRPACTLGDRASCERAAARADVCAARALPTAAGPDLRYLVALGPDRLDPYADDRPRQRAIPVREYFQLLRGSGVHAIGSLAQLADAFGRVVYDPREQPQLAASWFPAPVTGTVPAWSCAAAADRTATVLGAGGGLCAVLRERGTAHAAAGALLAEPHVVVFGAKTGTIDSLADIARKRTACAAWNRAHGPRAQLACGAAPPDDSLFVIAFGVETPGGTIPITLGLQLQRAGSGAAAHAAPTFVRAIARYLRGEPLPPDAGP